MVKDYEDDDIFDFNNLLLNTLTNQFNPINVNMPKKTLTIDLLLQTFIELTSIQNTPASIEDLSEEIQVNEEQIISLASNPDDLINLYYQTQLDDYFSAISELNLYEQLSFGDAFTHLILTLNDSLSVYRKFNQLCFHNVDSFLIGNSAFEIRIKDHLKSLLEKDNNIGILTFFLLNDLFYTHLVWVAKQLLSSSINENITDEQLIELTDKYADMLSAFLYNPIPDTTLNFIKSLTQIIISK